MNNNSEGDLAEQKEGEGHLQLGRGRRRSGGDKRLGQASREPSPPPASAQMSTCTAPADGQRCPLVVALLAPSYALSIQMLVSTPSSPPYVESPLTILRHSGLQSSSPV